MTGNGSRDGLPVGENVSPSQREPLLKVINEGGLHHWMDDEELDGRRPIERCHGSSSDRGETTEWGGGRKPLRVAHWSQVFSGKWKFDSQT